MQRSDKNESIKCRQVISFLLLKELIIFFSRDEIFGSLIRDKFEDPGVFRLIVDEGWIFLHMVIDLDDLSCHGRINICSCLHAFNCDDRVSGAASFAHCWEFNMDDFTKLGLGVIGDSNPVSVGAFDKLDPLVFFGVLNG